MCIYSDPVDLHAEYDAALSQTATCSECRRVIPSGEQLELRFYTYDGDGCVSRVCGQCQAARKWLDTICGDWAYECVLEDLDGHTEGGDEEEWHSAELAELVWSMRHGWTPRKVPVTSELQQGLPLMTVDEVEALTGRAIAASRDNHATATGIQHAPPEVRP